MRSMKELETLFSMLDKVFEKDTPKDTEKEETVRRDLEGFVPLVSDREVEAAKRVQIAVDEMRKVHTEEMYRFIRDFETITRDSTELQRCHYMMWCEACKELYNDTRSLDTDNIARGLAEARYDMKTTYKHIERDIYLNSLKDLLG